MAVGGLAGRARRSSRAAPRSRDLAAGAVCGRPWPAPWLGPAKPPRPTPTTAELGGLGTLDEPYASAEVIDLAVEAPHLAYLARVAALAPTTGYEADVIVFDSAPLRRRRLNPPRRPGLRPRMVTARGSRLPCRPT